jgi:hypothetical protein
MSGKIILPMAILIAFMFGGCAEELVAVGETETYCDEHCGNYADSGVCATPYDIFVKRHQYAKRAEFVNRNCKGCKE